MVWRRLQVKPSFQKSDVSIWGNASMAASWLYGWLFSRWTTRLLELRPALMQNAAAAAASVASPRARMRGLLSTRRSTFGASSKRRIRDAADQAARAEDANEAPSTGTVSASQQRTLCLLKVTAAAEQRAEYLRGTTEDAYLAWAARSANALAEPVDGMGKTYGVWRRLDEQQYLKALQWEARLAPVLVASRKLVARRRAAHEQLHATTVRVEALLQALLEGELLRQRAMTARRRYSARAAASVVPNHPNAPGPSVVPIPPPMPPPSSRPRIFASSRRARAAAAVELRAAGTTGAPLRPPGSVEVFGNDDDTPDTGIAL